MDVTLRELNDSVGKILQNLQQQAIKREESDVLLHILSSKLDIQGQKLQKLETDLRNVKEIVETRSGSRQKTEHPNSSDTFFAKQISGDNSLSIKEEILKSIQTNTDEVKCLIRDESQKLGNASLKSSCDIIVRVEAAESVILEARNQMKEVVSQVEDVDKGIRRVENSSNDNSVVLKSLQENLLSQDEVKNTFKGLKDASDRQLEALNQIMGKEELKMSLESFSSSINKIMGKEELKSSLDSVCSPINKIMVKEELKTTLDSISSSINKIMDKKELKSSLDSVSNSFNAKNNSLVHFLTEQKFNEKLEGLTQFTKEQIEDVKNELIGPGSIKEMVKRRSERILDQTVTESQITREFVRNTRKIRDTYICDMHVKDFIDFKSGDRENSHLFYIDQIETHLKGAISYDGKMLDIWINFGRYPAVLGLDKKKTCSDVKVKVKLVKPGRRDWVLGCETLSFDENDIPSNTDGWNTCYGYRITKISFDKLLSQGWVDDYDKVVFRYEIIVL